MESEPTYQRQTESDLKMATPSTTADQIRQGITISGPFIPEAMEVLACHPVRIVTQSHRPGREDRPQL